MSNRAYFQQVRGGHVRLGLTEAPKRKSLSRGFGAVTSLKRRSKPHRLQGIVLDGSVDCKAEEPAGSHRLSRRPYSVGSELQYAIAQLYKLISGYGLHGETCIVSICATVVRVHGRGLV